MNICGIVSEYNPFHSGHSYHIAQTRAALGTDTGIVCVMSGNFVQRGENAVFTKNARAEAAVRAGADLVLELPLPWAVSGAECFARGAVGMLGAAGAVTHLSFGSECGDLSKLTEAVELLLRPEMDEMTREVLDSGVSYAAARQTAAGRLAGSPMTILSQPNNILAIEYLKAIRTQHLPLAPITVRREGADHDALFGAGYPSAAQLRRMLCNGENVSSRIPASAYRVFERELEQGRGPVRPEALETAILSRLRMLPPEAYAALPDAGEGAENRLFRAAHHAATLSGVIDDTKTKRYAYSRLRRMALGAVLGLRAGDSSGIPPYLRVLAANGSGLGILRRMQETALLPVLTKPADVRLLDTRAQHTFALECAATDLFVLGFPTAAERYCGRDWRTSPFIMKNCFCDKSKQ